MDVSTPRRPLPRRACTAGSGPSSLPPVRPAACFCRRPPGSQCTLERDPRIVENTDSALVLIFFERSMPALRTLVDRFRDAGSLRDAEFGEDVRQMGLDGPGADVQ